MTTKAGDDDRVTVIGIDGGPLSGAANRRLEAATLVAGGARHLAGLPTSGEAERVVLGDVSAGLDALIAHQKAQKGPAVVLASGDPGFFGIGRLMNERGIDSETLPAVSSIATICARAGVSWDDAVVVSAHGRGPGGLRRAVNGCRAMPKVAVLTAPGNGPAELGAALTATSRSGGSFVIGERLGSDSEAVTRCCPSEAATRSWAEPNVVLFLAEGVPGERGWAFPQRQCPASWALDESAFEYRDSMITKSEVRALALARMGPGLGDLIWDLGAGSGSVAIECARFGAAVSAVEQDAEQCARIARNATAHGVALDVVEGRAPEALDALADPDAVFIGGGGADVTAIVASAAARSPRSIVVPLAAVERVGPVLHELRGAGYTTDGVQLAASRLAELPGEMTRLAAQNPVFVIWGTK